MFKKSLVAVAVLGAAAFSAQAADVQLYGLVDYGFQYAEKDTGAGKATHNFDMKSGMNSGSRFGLKGVEDLGNGYKVGFVLENGFNADDGTLGTSLNFAQGYLQKKKLVFTGNKGQNLPDFGLYY